MSSVRKSSWTTDDLPRGTVTFLFTDIVGSTRIAQASPEAYRAQLEDNRRIIRAAADTYSGIEVGHEGDSFFIAFERATDAIAAAEEARTDLEDQVPMLPVRFGIHSGEVAVTEDGYIGLTVHQAKRICDAANGFQILLSQTTATLVARLPEGTVVEDIGRYRLKDLGEPVSLFELRRRDSFGVFRRPHSLDTIPNNLPIQLTSIVGRLQDMDRLAELVDKSRLITITGAGGIGKTRFAFQVAGQCLDLYPDGVWSVELASLSDPSLVASTIARTLGIQGQSDSQTPTGSIAARFGSAHAMLLIDNCEHVIDECASIVHQLLTSCPHLTVLATSRQPLAIPGESVYPLPPLETVPLAEEPSEAARLFLERALTREPSLSTTAGDIDQIERLCMALDGIPLAIELAASRVGSMTPKEILDHFRENPLEVGIGARTAADRHRTLRAAIDWSYDLLDEQERLLLRRLSVMSGTFTAEAAREVCADRGLLPTSVPDLLRSLVDKSLLIAERAQSETTFRMLDSIKAHAHERLLGADGAAGSPPPARAMSFTFKKEGDVWAVGVPGAESRVRGTKGFALLLRLLENPGSEIHALDLMGAPSSEVAAPQGTALDTGSGLETLDAVARDQLRTRLEELAVEMREAEQNNDEERRAHLEIQMQQITDHLSEALGLGGRPRRSSSNAERARLAATKAIRGGIARIAEHEPDVAALLTQCVKTGTYCSYQPPAVQIIDWILS